MPSMAFFNNQGQITPKWLVWSDQNSNSSEILCMSWLSASLTKIRSIMNVLARRHHFPIIVYENLFQCSRPCNTEVNDPIRLEIEYICDLTTVLDTCKFGEDPIKTTEKTVETPFSPFKVYARFRLSWQPQFWSNLPQNLMQPFILPHWCYK